MLTVDQALGLVREACGASRCRLEHVALEAALGRVLAVDVAMDHAVPPFRRAAMDGFALAEPGSVGARYEVVARVAAGETADGEVRPGQAWRVMTGAPVPAGSRAVVPFEWTRESPSAMEVLRRPGTDTHIVEVGAHVAAGARVLEAGTRLAPAGLGVLAAAGVARVPVAARPSAAVLGTGSELVAITATPGPAQIRNSNNPTLLAQLAVQGAAGVDLGVVADEPDALRTALARGLEHDLLLISGGVSRGDLDLVPGTLTALGVRALFHGWSVQPGGPLWCGVRDQALVFALPGNPAASFVGFEVLVAPALATRLGRPFAPRARTSLPWGGAAAAPYARRRYRPVRVARDAEGAPVAEPVAWKGSGDPFALAHATGLAEVPEDGVASGHRVPVLDLGHPA